MAAVDSPQPTSLSERHEAGATQVRGYAGEVEDWDRFVRTTPGGTFFHLIGWKDVLEQAFGFESHYLTALRAGAIVGVLPLFELRPTFARGCLLSLPFAVEGGICAADEDARRALEEAALVLSRERGVRYLELRDGLDGNGFHIREGLYFRFRRPLMASDEENFAAIRRKQRRMVRVGQQSGLTARVSPDDLDAFYDLYACSVRSLGTPVFPYRYFRLFLERFPQDCVLLTVRHNGTPAAAVLSFFFNDTVLPYYAGSRSEFFRYAVNDFMYWELMRHARQRGARVFDFGRSKKGTGAYEYKCHWGFEPEPLRYRVYVQDGGPAPDHSASDGSVQLLRRVWKQLPLPITKLVGPFLLRRYGAYYT
jgi:FemAB-related protein (PEP-CTERM system-associated)